MPSFYGGEQCPCKPMCRGTNYVRRTLVKKGVEIMTSTRVMSCDAHGVEFEHGRLDADTIIWAAGVVASPADAIHAIQRRDARASGPRVPPRRDGWLKESGSAHRRKPLQFCAVAALRAIEQRSRPRRRPRRGPNASAQKKNPEHKAALGVRGTLTKGFCRTQGLGGLGVARRAFAVPYSREPTGHHGSLCFTLTMLSQM
jgi:hypothetical protein